MASSRSSPGSLSAALRRLHAGGHDEECHAEQNEQPAAGGRYSAVIALLGHAAADQIALMRLVAVFKDICLVLQHTNPLPILPAARDDVGLDVTIAPEGELGR